MESSYQITLAEPLASWFRCLDCWLHTVGYVVQKVGWIRCWIITTVTSTLNNFMFESEAGLLYRHFARSFETAGTERGVWSREVLSEAADPFPDRRSVYGESLNNGPFRTVSLGHMWVVFGCRKNLLWRRYSFSNLDRGKQSNVTKTMPQKDLLGSFLFTLIWNARSPIFGLFLF